MIFIVSYHDPHSQKLNVLANHGEVTHLSIGDNIFVNKRTDDVINDTSAADFDFFMNFKLLHA